MRQTSLQVHCRKRLGQPLNKNMELSIVWSINFSHSFLTCIAHKLSKEPSYIFSIKHQHKPTTTTAKNWRKPQKLSSTYPAKYMFKSLKTGCTPLFENEDSIFKKRLYYNTFIKSKPLSIVLNCKQWKLKCHRKHIRGHTQTVTLTFS